MSNGMGSSQVKLKLMGISPLIVHNGQLADPLNRFSKMMKAVTGKRKKVDADYEEMARLEFLGGLYLRDQKPCIPGVVLTSMMVSAAKKLKKGTDFKSGIVIDSDPFIEYDGPTDPDSLWADERFRNVVGVKVGQARVMRTRPMFPEWTLQFGVQFIDELINKRDIADVIGIAGWQIGLCEWRPRFGRFRAEMIE